MIDRLEATLEKYNSLTEELSKPEVLSDVKKMTSLSKEQASLADIIEKYKEYKKVVSDINDAKEMLDDKEMAAFAKEEISRLETEKENLEKELEVLLLPKDPNDDKNTIVEIRGAAGGDEANLFAGDLFEMYSRYAENMGWKIEIINAVEGTSGGYSQIEFMVKGENVYSKLKYESGTHRVQRVPSTESQGRVHTSTATVAVLPEVEDIISAKVVFPVPGGPHKMRELSVSFSSILRMVPLSPVRCSCPKTSSSVLGLSFSAKGIFWYKISGFEIQI